MASAKSDRVGRQAFGVRWRLLLTVAAVTTAVVVGFVAWHRTSVPAATLLAQQPAAPATPPVDGGRLAVQEALLENGFRVLVVQDRRVPRVAARLWYRFGSMQEPNGEHGSSHFLEHVVHQGTTTVGTIDFAAERQILDEIHRTEQQLVAEMNRQRNAVRERRVFYDELAWPTSPEIDKLRRQLYELEDRDARYRDFWAEFNWYRRYGTIGYADPVPASTEQEYLKIDIDVPKEYLELFFRLEADRMVNAVLRGWEAQRFTVFEQILNGLSRPETNFNHALDGTTAQAHPVYLPDGGHPRDFAFYNRAAMLRMYDGYFVPNNATLALVGDVDLQTARTLGERYFGRVPRGPEPSARLDMEAEPVPRGTIRLDWAEPLDSRVVVRYRIPGVGHPDRPLFDTIAALLRGRQGLVASRLGGLAASTAVDADFRVIHTYRFGSPGAINIIAHAARDEDLAAVEAATLAAVGALREGPIEPAALPGRRRRSASNGNRFGWIAPVSLSSSATSRRSDCWETLDAHMTARQTAPRPSCSASRASTSSRPTSLSPPPDSTLRRGPTSARGIPTHDPVDENRSPAARLRPSGFVEVSP